FFSLFLPMLPPALLSTLFPYTTLFRSIVFLKSIVRPCESVNLPSSIIWSKILNTSVCAFSTSSSKITEYGCLLTCSVSCPPSSYPTYPGALRLVLILRVFPYTSSCPYESYYPPYPTSFQRVPSRVLSYQHLLDLRIRSYRLDDLDL